MSEYRCVSCNRVWTFEEVTEMSKEEYLKLGERKANVNFRCPKCLGKTLKKVRPAGVVRKVKAR